MLKKTMLISATVLLAIISLNSCGGADEKETPKDEWSDDKKKEITKECVDGGGPQDMCDCMVEKMSQKYSTPSEAEKASKGNDKDFNKLIMDCL